MKILDLTGNFLRHLPDSFGQLQQLHELRIASNQFDIIDNCIFDCKQLSIIDLNYNRLKTIPNQINRYLFKVFITIHILVFRLYNLNELSLIGNQITKFCDTLILNHLHTLLIDANHLIEMPSVR